jgi:two-component system, OmpR family, phosphate regulon sensor histidine kinase PhoR
MWGRPLYSVILAGAIAFLVWLPLGTGRALFVLCVLLVVLLLHHLKNLTSLFRWLQAPILERVPVGSGAWEYVFSQMLRMLRRQRMTESELNRALQRFEMAGAALPDAVVILDEAGHVQWCNPKAEEYFGLDNKNDRGAQITNILRQPQFVEHLALGNVGETVTLRFSRGRGDIILSVQLVPYGDQQKLLLGRDITRWEKLETMRRDFVANVSHELRTPLTVVGGFLETLDDMDTLDADMARRSIKLMMQQTDRMTRLVEDLLTLSRLEGAHNPLREEDVDVPELLRGIHQEALALSSGRHKFRLKIDSQDGLKGSTEELRSAFSNLVSNAIRYTPEQGEIEIHWQIRNGNPTFSVRDSGIGIEPQHIDRLTERFYRVDRSRSRETGGTGLGLAIVKHVLNRHHARLDIQSEPGQGSVFTVVFPDTRRLAGHSEAAQSA